MLTRSIPRADKTIAVDVQGIAGLAPDDAALATLTENRGANVLERVWAAMYEIIWKCPDGRAKLGEDLARVLIVNGEQQYCRVVNCSQVLRTVRADGTTSERYLQGSKMLELCAPFAAGPRVCPPVVAIRDVLVAAFELHALADSLQQEILPEWEDRLRTLLERSVDSPVPIEVRWDGFLHAPHYLDAVHTLHFNRSAWVVRRIYQAVAQCVELYADGRRKLHDDLAKIVIKLVPPSSQRARIRVSEDTRGVKRAPSAGPLATPPHARHGNGNGDGHGNGGVDDDDESDDGAQLSATGGAGRPVDASSSSTRRPSAQPAVSGSPTDDSPARLTSLSALVGPAHDARSLTLLRSSAAPMGAGPRTLLLGSKVLKVSLALEDGEPACFSVDQLREAIVAGLGLGKAFVFNISQIDQNDATTSVRGYMNNYGAFRTVFNRLERNRHKTLASQAHHAHAHARPAPAHALAPPPAQRQLMHGEAPMHIAPPPPPPHGPGMVLTPRS